MISLAIWCNRHLKSFQRLQIVLAHLCNFFVFYSCLLTPKVALEIVLLPILIVQGIMVCIIQIKMILIRWGFEQSNEIIK